MKNPLGPTMTVDYSKVPGAAGYEISVSPNTGFSKSSTKRWETAAGGKTLTGLKKNTELTVGILRAGKCMEHTAAKQKDILSNTGSIKAKTTMRI